MRLFKSDVKVSAPPQPAGPTHIHNHAPSALGEIFGKVLAALIALIASWFVGVFILGRAGFSHPDRTLASAIIWLAGAAIFVFLGNHFVENVLDRWFEHREAMEDRRAEQLRYRQIMQQSAVTDSRQSGERARLTALALAVMWSAYEYYERNGAFRGAWRPWSRRSAGKVILHGLGETQPVGEAFGEQARQFLKANQVITGDSPNEQINIAQFPDIASVQRLLYYPLLMKGSERQ